MDSRFKVTTIAQTEKPNQVVYTALHQCYSEGESLSEVLSKDKTEQWFGEKAIKLLLGVNINHFGSLEHPAITFQITGFPHSVMQQARTHRVGISVDCQCLSGDSVVTFVDNTGSSSPKLKKTMGELYDLWHNGEKAIRERKKRGRKGEPPGTYRRDAKTRIKKMRIRSLDETTNTFTSNHIEDVVFSGLNPVYKVTLLDGKVFKCTENHRIFTPLGWKTLKELSVGSQVMVNGIPLDNAPTTYQNKIWLEEQFNRGLKPKDIALLLGCSTSCVKKWAYHFGLDWDKTPYNLGTTFTLNISEEERLRRANHMTNFNQERKLLGLIPSGESHHAWKNLPPEQRVYNWQAVNRDRIIESKGSTCSVCGSKDKLHLHHIKPVKQYPELAYEEGNLEVLCASCHNKHHKLGTKNPLCSHPVEIISIEYSGVEPTYDLVLAAPNHNFVADGVVVHNSMRYTSQRFLRYQKEYTLEDLVYIRPVGFYTDRSGNKYHYTEEMRCLDVVFAHEAILHYNKCLELGYAPEQARGLLPFDFRQNFVMSFNLRSLMHFLDLRSKKDAQLEIQQLSSLMMDRFYEWSPEFAGWYDEHRYSKARLAP